KKQSLAVVDEFDFRERQFVSFEFPAGGLRERGSQFLMIESGLARCVLGVHNDEFLGSFAQVVAIPEAGIVLEPVRIDLGLIDSSLRRAETAGAKIGVYAVRGGEGFLGRQRNWLTLSETPNSNNQHPEKLQFPNSKSCATQRLIWDLKLDVSLEVGCW